jgi:hypothetical protein
MVANPRLGLKQYDFVSHEKRLGAINCVLHKCNVDKDEEVRDYADRAMECQDGDNRSWSLEERLQEWAEKASAYNYWADPLLIYVSTPLAAANDCRCSSQTALPTAAEVASCRCFDAAQSSS